MPQTYPAIDPIYSRFKPLRLLLVAVVLLLTISGASRWYSANVLLPRYCQQPEQTLQYLEANMTDKKPEGKQQRRNFMIAAKLEYLVPRGADEPINGYLLRLRQLLREQCH